MRRPKPVKPPDQMAAFLVSLRGIADDPVHTEGTLREMLRRAAGLLETQHKLIESQARNMRRLVWHFGVLAVLWGLMFGWQVAMLLKGGST